VIVSYDYSPGPTVTGTLGAIGGIRDGETKDGAPTIAVISF